MLRRRQQILFEDCARGWLEEKREILKESTVTTYSRMLEAQLLPMFGEMQVKEITKELIKEGMRQKACAGRVDGKGGLSAKSCKDLLVLLMAILKYAEDKFGTANVMKKTLPKEMVSAPEPVFVETLTEEENRILSRELLKRADGEAVGILLSLYMGLRLGEICALRWENIDLEREIVRVRVTMARVMCEGEESKTKLVFTTPKTKNSVRDVPIPEVLLLLMKRQKSRSGFLLTGTEDWMDMRTMQNHFKKILKEAGLRAVHFHCLRHTFATNCVSMDFDIKTISEILGHASTTITWERYVHSSMHRKQLLMRQLTEKMCI